MLKPTSLSLLFILSGLTADAGEIRLRERAECSEAIVRLGDVADIHASDVLTQHRLAEIALFPAPQAGGTRILKRQELQELLALSDVPLHEFRLTGAAAARLQVKKAEPSLPPTSTAEVAPAPEAPVKLAVFTTRPLRQGTVVQAADVQLQPTNNPADATAVAALEEIVGQELKRSLSAGQAVQLDQIQSPRLVQRGDDVTIQCLAAGIKITTSGRALASGGQGDVVEVEIADSREQLLARVVAARTVAIYAAAPTFAGAHSVDSKPGKSAVAEAP